MSTTEVLCRHFSRMGARLKFQTGVLRPGELVRIDVDRDRSGEFFDLRCKDGVVPEVLNVNTELRHLVLMVRDRGDKNKFLLGRDERHWFAAAVPGNGVHDVRTAIKDLRPVEAEGPGVIRQGEWFFVPVRNADHTTGIIHRNEPLSRGAGSKPHICAELMRAGGETVMVSQIRPTGIPEADYERLIETNPKARRVPWRRMIRDALVFARGEVRHRDHKTVHLDGWHQVYMNRERFAKHAPQIAFLD